MIINPESTFYSVGDGAPLVIESDHIVELSTDLILDLRNRGVTITGSYVQDSQLGLALPFGVSVYGHPPLTLEEAVEELLCWREVHIAPTQQM